MGSVITICENCQRGDHRDCLALAILPNNETLLCNCEEHHSCTQGLHVGEYLATMQYSIDKPNAQLQTVLNLIHRNPNIVHSVAYYYYRRNKINHEMQLDDRFIPKDNDSHVWLYKVLTNINEKYDLLGALRLPLIMTNNY